VRVQPQTIGVAAVTHNA